MPSSPVFPSDSEISSMPNKTIYVADADLPVFERAQELAGENLSATIASALRRFVKAEEARQQGFEEISVKVGSRKTFSIKRFMGRELARHRDRDEEAMRIITQTIFQTAKGRLALYTHRAPDWTAWSAGWANAWRGDWDVDVDVDPEQGASWTVRRGKQRTSGKFNWRGQDWSTFMDGDERALDVYETFDELKEHIGQDLANAVAQALRGEDDEFLDI